MLERIVQLGDKKHEVSPADLPYIIADVLGRPDDRPVHVASYRVTVGSSGAPEAEIELTVRGERAAAKAVGDGGYDAFMKAVAKAARRFGLELPRLEDFRVRIPPGGRTEALVETLITWRGRGAGESSFSTLGVDSDQMAAAVIATEKMLNAVAARVRRRPAAR